MSKAVFLVDSTKEDMRQPSFWGLEICTKHIFLSLISDNRNSRITETSLVYLLFREGGIKNDPFHSGNFHISECWDVTGQSGSLKSLPRVRGYRAGI